MTDDTIRLSKRVAEIAACSRSEAEMLIEGGWVQVNGRVVEEPGHRVSTQVVHIDPDARPEPILPVTLLWHRPPDAGPCDPEALRHIPVPGLRLLRKNLLHQQAVAPLDAPFTGLVVFTQDGRIRRRLFEDAALIEHEYMVELPGQLTDQGIDNLRQHLQQARAWPQVPVVGKISLNARSDKGTRLRIALKGSDAGLVGALCTRSGLRPLAVQRTRLGRVGLAGLPAGAWRFLQGHEKF